MVERASVERTGLPVGDWRRQMMQQQLDQLSPEEQQAFAQQAAITNFISRASESCFFKLSMAGVMGFGLGGVFGLFMSSLSLDTVDHKVYQMRFKDQMRTVGRDMAQRSWSSAKNFGLIGLIYSGSECCIESIRAKNDLGNALSAGAFTGAVLAYKSGPRGMLLGAAGFSLFSGAIEYYMRRP